MALVPSAGLATTSQVRPARSVATQSAAEVALCVVEHLRTSFTYQLNGLVASGFEDVGQPYHRIRRDLAATPSAERAGSRNPRAVTTVNWSGCGLRVNVTGQLRRHSGSWIHVDSAQVKLRHAHLTHGPGPRNPPPGVRGTAPVGLLFTVRPIKILCELAVQQLKDVDRTVRWHLLSSVPGHASLRCCGTAAFCSVALSSSSWRAS